MDLLDDILNDSDYHYNSDDNDEENLWFDKITQLLNIFRITPNGRIAGGNRRKLMRLPLRRGIV
eukprot:6679676-Ditylum_brightwellii.AAC.1